MDSQRVSDESDLLLVIVGEAVMGGKNVNVVPNDGRADKTCIGHLVSHLNDVFRVLAE